ARSGDAPLTISVLGLGLPSMRVLKWIWVSSNWAKSNVAEVAKSVLVKSILSMSFNVSPEKSWEKTTVSVAIVQSFRGAAADIRADLCAASGLALRPAHTNSRAGEGPVRGWTNRMGWATRTSL